MKKIKGLTQEEILEVGEKVARNHSHKVFGYYTNDDIHQEVWIIILDRLNDFDASKVVTTNIKKGLENFLNSVVSKRLINLYRDKYLVPQRHKTDHPGRYGTSHMPNEITDDVEEKTVHSFDWTTMDKELLEYVIEQLTPADVKILEAILNGENISPYYRGKVSRHVKELIAIYGNRQE